MVTVFSYLDYRQFIKEYIADRKVTDAYFSYRFLAPRIGIDHSLLIRIAGGKRHIGDSMIASLATAMKLPSRESRYFEMLVRFCKTEDREKKAEVFEKLAKMRQMRTKVLLADQFEYFKSWHHVAIRSLIDCSRFSGDFQNLTARLNPSIAVTEVKRSVALLTRLGLITKDECGVYSVSEHHITTGSEWSGLAIAAFQRDVIALSALSLDRDPKERRDISSLTMSVDEACFAEIKQMLKACREQIIRRVDAIPSGTTDRVYQLNLQFIPLSIPVEGSTK